MNKMLILIFSLVSLSSGSILNREEATEATVAETTLAPVVTDAVVPEADATVAATTLAPVTTPASLYYALDGCSDAIQGGRGCDKKCKGWKEGDLQPGLFDGTTEAGEIVCCEKDGSGSCSRKTKDGQCRSGHNTAFKVTWEAAKKHCEDDGKRLCASQAELDTCCNSGCQYDNQLVWTSLVEGDENAPTAPPATEAPEVGSCKDGDVKLMTDGTPLVFWDGQFTPICGHWFWNNNYGATLFCKKLGYESGVKDIVRGKYGVKSVVLGTCREGRHSAIEYCTRRHYLCGANDRVSITITCDGVAPAKTESSCEGEEEEEETTVAAPTTPEVTVAATDAPAADAEVTVAATDAPAADAA